MKIKLLTFALLLPSVFRIAYSQPVVYYASDPVFANETVLTATGNTDANSSAVIAQLPNGAAGSPLNAAAPLPPFNPATMVQSSPTSVKFLVPPNFTTGAYAFKIETASGVSATQYLNVPHVMFIQGDMGSFATPGGWIETHGRTVGLPGGAPRLALVNGNQITFLTSNPKDSLNDTYRQRFLVPKTLAPGTYSIYSHNGYGGTNGWVKFQSFVTGPVSTFTVANAPTQSTMTVNVPAPGGVNDDGLITSAITSLPAGGTINLAAGTYALQTSITLPNNVTLQGAGQSATTLNWVSDPMSGSSYLPLITGAVIGHVEPSYAPIRATFNVSNLSMVASSTYNGIGIDREFTSAPGMVSNVSLKLPLVGNSSSPVRGIRLNNTSNFTIVNSTIDARTGIYCLTLVNNIRIENDVFKWREASLFLSGNDYNFIVNGNTLDMQGDASTNGWSNDDNPGFWFTTDGGFPNFSGAYTENVYYAHNASTHEEAFTSAENIVGLTFDGGNGIYFGGVQGVSTANGVTTVTLQSPTLSQSGGHALTYEYAGGVMKVESGTGMGQWAYISSASPGSTTVTINQPFAVPLDSTSVVSIVNMQGAAIFDGNYFGADPTNQSYYFSMDVIKANNTYASGADTVWTGSHYGMPFSGWHYQFLNNTITVPGKFIEAFTTGGITGYTGPIAADFIYRNNVNSSSGSSIFMVRSASGLFRDAIVEGNKVAYVGLGSMTDPLNFDGIVLRNNPGASYNIGALQNKNPASVVGVAYLP